MCHANKKKTHKINKKNAFFQTTENDKIREKHMNEKNWFRNILEFSFSSL
jgi:hypothetical protein